MSVMNGEVGSERYRKGSAEKGTGPKMPAVGGPSDSQALAERS